MPGGMGSSGQPKSSYCGDQMRAHEDFAAIRPLEAGDATAIWRLIEVTPELDKNSHYLYLLLGTHFGDTCVVAERQGQIVGVVTGFRPPTHPQRLFVWQLAVHPESRGQGIARRLVECLLDMQSMPVERLDVTIAPDNAASQAVFRSIARRRRWTIESAPFLCGTDVPSEAGPHDDEWLFVLSPSST